MPLCSSIQMFLCTAVSPKFLRNTLLTDLEVFFNKIRAQFILY